ncbi:MAG TPA: MFS transporter [Chloroflexota bacterium]|nr:MFS transporter [Chloroflexota bacterium]
MSSPAPDSSSGTHSVTRLLVEPRRPTWVATRPDAHWLVVGTVCIGALMGQLDASIVSLALPTLRVDFHASIGAVEWVALAYLLTLVSAVVAIGRFSDMAGRKLLYTYGFGIFILGSALCGLAPNLSILIAARVLQGLGAAVLQANSVALIVQAMPEGMLGRGIGVQGAAQAVGLAVGPAIGGFLISVGGWRLIFFVNVPVGLLGLLLGWFLLPRSRHLLERKPFDWPGLALIIPAVAAPLAAISLGMDVGWTSPLILGSLTLGLAFAVLFIRRERQAVSPLVDPALFRNTPFTAGLGSGLLSYLVMFGVLFVVPFYLEARRGLGVSTAGLLLAALPVSLGIVAPIAGKLADRVGTRPITAGGMLVTATGLAALAIVRRPEAALVAELAWIGVGLGAFTPANNAAIVAAAPRTHSGLAGGILNMTRGLGTSLGVALTGLAFTLLSGNAAQVGRLSENASLTRGFVGAMVFLVGVALAAAVLAVLRGTGGHRASA